MAYRLNRLVYFYSAKLVCSTRARGNDLRAWTRESPIGFDNFFASWASVLANGGLSQQNKSKTFQIYLADVKDISDWFVLLINFTDSTRGGHVFRNTQTGNETIHALAKHDGLNHSCHILIKKAPELDGRHMILFEKNGPMPFSKVASFLSHICQQVSVGRPELEVDHPFNGVDSKGAVKKIRLIPKLVYNGYVADDLIDDIMNGYLSNIELITDSIKEGGIDSVSLPEVQTQILKIKSEVPPGSTPWDIVSKWLGVGSNIDYEQLRVVFKNETGASETVNFDTVTRNLINEEKYTKKNYFYFTLKPATAFSNIKGYVVKRILRLI